MSLINRAAEQAVIEQLQKTGPCSMDDLILSLRDLSCDTIVATINHLSKERRVLMRRYGAYDINHNIEIPKQAA
ncbi:MAG TPA: hypothetical protein VJU02_03900 [Nitrospiraceae bacterium]|nr:hypothetical protein [Nitrospiraceae bacterium]